MALTGSMLDWGAYDKTDPEKARRAMLEQQALQPGRRGEQAAALLARMDQVTAHDQDLQEGRRQTLQNRRDIASDREAGLNERAGVRADAVRQAQADRRTQGLVAGMNALSYDNTPAGKAALAATRNEYLKDVGINVPSNAGAAATTTGAYGPGGPAIAPVSGQANIVASAPPPPPATPRDATAAIFGTSVATPNLPQAQDIPQIYGGGPSVIPETARPGYYDSQGTFLGPSHSPQGDTLPLPKGATGLRGEYAQPTQAGAFAGNPPTNENVLPMAYTPPAAPVATNAPYQPPPVQPFVTPTSGRGEFAGNYPIKPPQVGRLLDFPTVPPAFIVPAERKKLLDNAY